MAQQALGIDEVVRLCILGDEGAWAEFVERFNRLVRWAVRDKISRTAIFLNEKDIDDISQQAFINIWRGNRLKDIKNIKALSSWLVVVAQNAAVDFTRIKRTSPQHNLSQTDTAKFNCEETISLSATQPAEVDNNQLYKTVEELISELPLREKRIMTLELFYDLKHREIANIMGMPINTVSTIIARIKQGLGEKLKRRGYNA